MNRKKIIPIIAVGTLALALVGGALTYRAVQAAALPAVKSAMFANGIGRGAMGGVSDQNLATALGISVDQLQAAYKTATAEALKEAVTNGDITQKESDQMTANGDVLRGNEDAWLSSNGIDYNTILANVLGISADKLNTAYQSAYFSTLDTAVKDGQMTQAQADEAKARYSLSTSSKFTSAIQSAYEAAIKQAVTDGLITQSQADQILKSNSGLNFSFGRGMGDMGGMRGMGGPGGLGGFGGNMGGFGRHGNPNNNNSGTTNPTPAAPSATQSNG